MEFNSITEELSAIKFKKNMERDIEDYFESKGFDFIQPRIFQSYDDYLLSNHRQDSSKMVKVLGGDSNIYILRPDITTNILGLIFSKWDGEPPLKVYYNSIVFNNSSIDGINENYQVGVESLGDEPEKADKEILEMAISLLERLNRPYLLELGSSTYIDSYLKELNLEGTIELKIRDLISRKNRDELKALAKDIDKEGILQVILNMEGNMEEVIELAKKNYMNTEMELALDSLDSLVGFLKERNLDSNINLDLSMIPDLDYYDGIIFKAYCHGSSKKVISGGRYDKLTEKFGKNVAAIGFMMDMDIARQIRYRGLAK